jgi:hypothetical protein
MDDNVISHYAPRSGMSALRHRSTFPNPSAIIWSCNIPSRVRPPWQCDRPARCLAHRAATFLGRFSTCRHLASLSLVHRTERRGDNALSVKSGALRMTHAPNLHTIWVLRSRKGWLTLESRDGNYEDFSQHYCAPRASRGETWHPKSAEQGRTVDRQGRGTCAPGGLVKIEFITVKKK